MTNKTLGEVKLMTLRETPVVLADTPEKIANYYNEVISKSANFTDDTENFYVIFLNTRRKIIGYQLVTMGTLDTLHVHPRETFRAAIVANCNAIVILHNHPSGDSTPSDADIRCTKDLINGGKILKIELLDHVIMGHANNGRGYTSLRELGYFSGF
jgi:DNA repair protein RadC